MLIYLNSPQTPRSLLVVRSWANNKSYANPKNQYQICNKKSISWFVCARIEVQNLDTCFIIYSNTCLGTCGEWTKSSLNKHFNSFLKHMDGPLNCPNCLKKLTFSGSYSQHKLVCPFRTNTSPITIPLLSGSSSPNLTMTLPTKHTINSLQELLVRKKVKLPSDSEDEDPFEVKQPRNTKSAVKSVRIMDPESDDMRSTKTAVKSVRIVESVSESEDDEFVVKRPSPAPKASNNRRVPVSSSDTHESHTENNGTKSNFSITIPKPNTTTFEDVIKEYGSIKGTSFQCNRCNEIIDNSFITSHVRSCPSTHSLRKWIFNFTLIKHDLIDDPMIKLWNCTRLQIDNLVGWENCMLVQVLQRFDTPKVKCLRCEHIMNSNVLGNILPHFIMCTFLTVSDKLKMLVNLLNLYKHEYNFTNNLTMKHPLKVQSIEDSMAHDISIRGLLMKEQQEMNEIRHLAHLEKMEAMRMKKEILEREIELLKLKRADAIAGV